MALCSFQTRFCAEMCVLESIIVIRDASGIRFGTAGYNFGTRGAPWETVGAAGRTPGVPESVSQRFFRKNRGFSMQVF